VSGRMAGRLQESVGHGEMAIRLEDGSMGTFTSLMEEGTVIKDLKTRLDDFRRSGNHYIVLKLQQRPTEEQIVEVTRLARELMARNVAWKTGVNARRARIVSSLPLPQSWKDKLIARFKASGYDWFGLYTGRLTKDHWTCIAACLELYHSAHIKTARYGTGLLGIGTGLFDPIMPVRFLDDPAFRLLTV